MERGDRTTSARARVAMLKMAQSGSSGSAEMVLDVTAHEPCCSFYFSPEQIHRRSSPTLVLFTMVHSMKQSLRAHEEANRHALLPSSESYTVHSSTEPSTANILLSTVSQSHQHEYENRAAFVVPRAKARSSVSSESL